MTVVYNPRTEEYIKICNVVVPKGGTPCVSETWKKAVPVTENTVAADPEFTGNMDSQDLLSGQSYYSDGGDT